MEKEKRNILKNQKGFTLIEIIAVLIILGILAAVAVPRFLDLSEEAYKKTLQAAIAAGKSNVTLVYAKNVLETGLPTRAGLVDDLDDPDYTNLGDFTAVYSEGGVGCINVKVTADDDNDQTDEDDICGLQFAAAAE